MFVNNVYSPYWWATGGIQGMPFQRRTSLNYIDQLGIACVTTNGVTLSDDATTVDYGISPCVWKQLPCQSLVLLTIHADVPAGGETLPVTIVVPNGGSSTVSTSGATTGTTKINVVDSQGENVTGANVQGNTQRFAYIDKSTGTIRFLEFTNV